MADYSITFLRSARKQLEVLSSALIARIFTQIESLAKSPRPNGCRKLKGSEELWRIRIGDYRVIYSVDDKLHVVDIVAVRHRSQAYD